MYNQVTPYNSYISSLQSLWKTPFTFSHKWLEKLIDLYQGIRSQARWVQATILFTDVAGFSAAIAHLPQNRQQQVFESLTGEYYPLLQKCVRDYGGSVDKFIGDGMMAVFRTPGDAINAAYQIRERVARFNTEQEKAGRCPFPTRMAIDSGPVLFVRQSWRRGIVAPGTYLGEAVNRAAHLAQVGPPGRVRVSQNTLDQLADKSNFVAWPEGRGQGLAVYELWPSNEFDVCYGKRVRNTLGCSPNTF